MSELELVRALENYKPSQTRELYRRGDEYFVVSTVEVGDGATAPERAIGGLTNLFAGLAGAEYDYPTSGEETMAFPADPDGAVTDWGEVAVASGDGSREDVLEQLRSAS